MPTGSSRRTFLHALTLPAASAQVTQDVAKPEANRPNILYIHSHDSGRYLQPYGYAVPTPNLHKLADTGVLFRQAFSGAPTCSPSRAALLTGQCAHKSGMTGLAHRGFALNDVKQHVLHTLRPAGYQSILAGVQHVAARKDQIGYDTLLESKTNSAVEVAPAAVSFLDARPKQPFFLDVGFFETHREFPEPTAADDPRFILPPAQVPDTAATRRDMAGYHASARVLDRGVGAVLDALERNGYAGNTLVISTTDHGPAFPRMKCNMVDAGWGVSLIMRGPGQFSKPQVLDAMISHIDVFPTLCEYLGIAKPAWLEGKSFLPVVDGSTKEINDTVFAEVTYHAAYEPKRAVRTHRHKYVRRYGALRTPVLPNCDDSLSKSVWMENGWRSQRLPRESLYDLVFDPHEQHDLARDPLGKTALEEMRVHLDKWMDRTDDPLLKGEVPAPAGAEFNDPAGISPKEPTKTA